MPTSTQPRPAAPPPTGQGVLLPAVQAALTRHGIPFTPRPATLGSAPPRVVDAAASPAWGAAIALADGAPPGHTLAAAPPLTSQPWPDGIMPPDGFASVPPVWGGPGFGFGDGEPLDTAAPGVGLAGLAEDAHASLARVDDDCLVGVIRGWRRIASWAAGRELAAVAELARRRPADGLPGSGREFVADELAAALTLTIRAAQGERDLAWQLAQLLPATLAALSAGQIDLPRARVIADGTAELMAGHAAAVEAAVLPRAGGLTTGQLRAAVATAVLAADPDAAARRRTAARARAHVSCWAGPAGTAHLEGHDLPAAQTLAADARLGQIAAGWKAQGAQGGLDLLRAHAYLALLLGHDTSTPPSGLLLPSHRTPHPSTPAPSTPAPSTPAPSTPAPSTPASSTPASSATGTVSTGAGPGHGASPGSDSAASATGATTTPAGPGHGASPGSDSTPGTASVPGSDADADGMDPGGDTTPGPGGSGPGVAEEGDPGVPAGLRPPGPQPERGTWPALPPVAATINLTIPLATLVQLGDSPGEAPGYGPVDPGTARTLAAAAAGHPATRWQITVTSPHGQALGHGTTRRARRPGHGWTVAITPIATGGCGHRHQEPGYRPSPRLQQLIRARTTTCCYPGCRRPAARCDLDHTIAYEDGGITCECDLAPSRKR
jgi:Domain of unknown function (DUF222)